MGKFDDKGDDDNKDDTISGLKVPNFLKLVKWGCQLLFRNAKETFQVHLANFNELGMLIFRN